MSSAFGFRPTYTDPHLIATSIETGTLDVHTTSTFEPILTVSNTTDSASSVTGAIVCAGGAGIAKKLFVGSTTGSTSAATGSFVTAGGAGIGKELFIGSTTASTSTSTGALVVAGGMGVAKSISAVQPSGTVPGSAVGGGVVSIATGAGETVNTALGAAVLQGGMTFANGVYTIPAGGTGIYAISYQVGVVGVSATWVAYVIQNASATELARSYVPAATANVTMAGSVLVTAAAGDTFKIHIKQSEVGALDMSSAVAKTYFTIYRLP